MSFLYRKTLGRLVLAEGWWGSISVNLLLLEACRHTTLSHATASHVSIVIVLKYLRHRIHSCFLLNLETENAWAGRPAELGNHH